MNGKCMIDLISDEIENHTNICKQIRTISSELNAEKERCNELEKKCQNLNDKGREMYNKFIKTIHVQPLPGGVVICKTFNTEKSPFPAAMKDKKYPGFVSHCHDKYCKACYYASSFKEAMSIETLVPGSLEDDVLQTILDNWVNAVPFALADNSCTLICEKLVILSDE